MPNIFTCCNTVLAKVNKWRFQVYIWGLQRRAAVTIRRGMDDLAPAATAPIKETGRQPGDASPKTALGRYGVRKKSLASLFILASSKGAYITDPPNCFVRICTKSHSGTPNDTGGPVTNTAGTLQSDPDITTSVYATPRL